MCSPDIQAYTREDTPRSKTTAIRTLKKCDIHSIPYYYWAIDSLQIFEQDLSSLYKRLAEDDQLSSKILHLADLVAIKLDNKIEKQKNCEREK